VAALVAAVSKQLAVLSDWTAPAIHTVVSGFAAGENLALGKLAQPIRLAVCGGTVSPPIDATLVILGRDQTLARLAAAVAVWSG
jgi:glutamyl-tRNA synthetase